MNHLPVPPGLKKAGEDKARAEKELENLLDSKEFKDRVSVLTIAYHNLAVEQEFLHLVSLSYEFDFCYLCTQYDEAQTSFREAMLIAKKFLGEVEGIT